MGFQLIVVKHSRTVGYLRVSTAEQDLEKNKAEILHLANDKGLGQVEWVEEKVSGKVSWKKREIGRIIHDLNEGDNLIVSELSRFGRSTFQCLEILKIGTDKKINIYAVKGNWQLDDSVQSKVMATMFAVFAEIERDLISLRTKEALAAKKAQGIKLGRPKGSGKSKLDTYRPEIEALLNNGATQKFIASRFKTTEANLSRWLNKHNLRRNRKT